MMLSMYVFFFFNDTATTEIYTLSLHDALPISGCESRVWPLCRLGRPAFRKAQEYAQIVDHRFEDARREPPPRLLVDRDRKSTRLNSSHANISYAVFCLKKKNNYLLLLSFSYFL